MRTKLKTVAMLRYCYCYHLYNSHSIAIDLWWRSRYYWPCEDVDLVEGLLFLNSIYYNSMYISQKVWLDIKQMWKFEPQAITEHSTGLNNIWNYVVIHCTGACIDLDVKTQDLLYLYLGISLSSSFEGVVSYLLISFGSPAALSMQSFCCSITLLPKVSLLIWYLRDHRWEQ